MRWINELLASRWLALGFLLASVAFTVFIRYGGGTAVPALDADFSPFNRPPELVAQTDVPLRRIVLGPDGTIYGVIHPKFQTPDLKVVSLKPGATAQPFPNQDWQRGQFTRPTSITVDGRGLVWLAEDHPFGQTQPRILAIDPRGTDLVVNQSIQRQSLPRGSELSDIALSFDGMHIVLADSSPLGLSSRLLHFDIAAQTISPRLVRHSSLRASRYKAVVDGVTFGAPFGISVHREGANGLAFLSNGQGLVFGGAANDGLFLVPTDSLFFPSGDDYSADSLASKITRLGQKSWSEGIATDLAGNVYFTDAPGGRVMRRAPDGTLAALVPEGTFLWPSGLAFGPSGGLYVSETALNNPRWRLRFADILDEAPLGMGRWLAKIVRGNVSEVGGLGIWRLDVGMSGVLG